MSQSRLSTGVDDHVESLVVLTSILRRPILEIAPKVNGLIPQDLLRFFYYAGMVHIGLKDFSKALDSFLLVSGTCIVAGTRFDECRQCITAPSAVLSAIVVEAYKKYILISLIKHGQVRIP
jgi:COP9 signalosome complex subunit 3